MELYFTKNRSDNPIAIIQFGIGLLGTGIMRLIDSKIFFKNIQHHSFPFNWDNELNYSGTISNVFNTFISEFKSSRYIYIVWSAGSSNFNSSIDEVNSELNVFKRINQLLSLYIKSFSKESKILFLSSAGGLFEGQVVVNVYNNPMPIRPYGVLKKEQESFLMDNKLYDHIEVLRISSVYSTSKSDHRKGLIQVLLENGIKNKVSTIYGDDSTIRDYVLVEDISRYIISTIYFKYTNPVISFLVSGQPRSIYEIRKLVEKLLRKKLFIVYSNINNNALNISFSPSVVNRRFQTMDFNMSIQKLKHSLNL